MARTHGKNADFSFNAIAIENELNTVTMTATVPPADVTAFADAYGVGLAGKKNVVTEVSGSYADSVDQAVPAEGFETLYAGIGAGVKSTIFDPTGSGPGANDPEYRCTAAGLTGVLVARLSLSLPVGDKASYRATLQHSGSTTRAVA